MPNAQLSVVLRVLAPCPGRCAGARRPAASDRARGGPPRTRPAAPVPPVAAPPDSSRTAGTQPRPRTRRDRTIYGRYAGPRSATTAAPVRKVRPGRAVRPHASAGTPMLRTGPGAAGSPGAGAGASRTAGTPSGIVSVDAQ